MRFFIELSYNGKAYHGWQIQPTAISVQEVVEKALSTLLKSEIAIMGAGRTDAGVHASQLFAHFDYDEEIDEKKLTYKLNSFLPKDIAVKSIFKVKPEAHARFDALSRTYHYKISTAKDVFNYDYSYQVHLPLDLKAMNEACKILYEYKDFQCFSKTNTDVKTYNCDIKEAFWTQEDNHLMFTITADRFLRNMVRAIVGTMVNIGLGKMKAEDLHQIIASKNRSEAGFSVPAHGLYLVKIVYPETIKLED
ncbi:tRNA pseudouridine(38-40) synthase [Winogradskyella epiphytica]|uniref:tRNA pseudouridine synthase A n=1 Tax=Winogradskyella epiphytica TaxID=262005 RepID=A0A2V4XQ38_9FLAO|nr:tRNA pseudouridine(38-40) synthase TruA [Winogradskyella epiphytica]PYE79642.1 tRNA pseudouridine(38-40) synthase [Winogradskyella epiphytica]GGW73656.1 tRNA pseudouridine synthase A [Winogradskyella epiphytica]